MAAAVLFVKKLRFLTTCKFHRKNGFRLIVPYGNILKNVI